MNKILSILLLTFIFTQEPILDTEVVKPCPECPTCEVCPPICEGTCLSEEESQGLFNNIKELQFNLDKSTEINGNLQLQITDYDKSILNYKEQFKLQEEQIRIKEDMIKTIKPAWHENKYLWYSMGVLSMIVPIWGIGQIK